MESSVVTSKLLKACVICTVFMIVEFIAGAIANSLALMTDAVHLLSDLSSFGISLFAIWVATLPGTSSLSFGYHRAEILGALMSVVLIWCITGGLCYEAISRIRDPPAVNGRIMFATAGMGTAANVIMTYILGVHSHGLGGHSHDCGGGHDHDHSHDIKHGHDHVHNGHSGMSPGKQRVTPEGKLKDTPLLDATWRLMPDGVTADEWAGSTKKCKGVPASKTESVESSPSRYPSQLYLGEARKSDSAYPVEGEEKRYVSLGDGDCHSHTHSHAHATESINLRAAYIHAVGDLIQNIGVMFASALIWWRPSLALADPLCTLMFSVFVLITTFQIIREATNVLMEGTPPRTDIQMLMSDLMLISGVCGIHDFHVWSLSIGKPSLACHLVIESEELAPNALRVATDICQRKYNIQHTTIQIDFSQFKAACETDAHSKCHAFTAEDLEVNKD